MNKKIVIISNYYPPEMGAAANRIRNLAEGLKNKDNDVTVICPLPNYPTGKVFKAYKNRFKKEEEINGINVKRYWLYPSNSQKSLVRLFSMLSFAISLWFSVFSLMKRKPDLIIVQSPPLFVALSGLLLTKFIGCKNILNVSDLWPLSALELGVIKKGKFYSLLEKIELKNYKLADKIIGQSNEIIAHIKTKVDKSCLVYRNVSPYKDYSSLRIDKTEEPLKIVYAGLLGYAQGVYKICEELDFRKMNVEFHIYGAGMEEAQITSIARKSENNIYYHGSRSATEIKSELLKYDVSLVPLRNNIYGAVPSKIFELMQLGIPILFFSDGEGAQIVRDYEIGLTSKSGNYKLLSENVLKFGQMDKNSYDALVTNSLNRHKQNYNLEKQMSNLIDFIEKKKN